MPKKPSMQDRYLTPSQSAVLQMRDEKGIVLEAYDFLDEKRLLLAAELLRQLADYEALVSEYEQLRQDAEQALQGAVGRHGLHGVQVYPAPDIEANRFYSQSRKFMGVTLTETDLEVPEFVPPEAICNASAEAENCRVLFSQLMHIAARLAGLSGNLQRLMIEYERTERRARALENVVLPELEQALTRMTGQLEEIDQEETIRIHQRHG